jgi:hypothetical protein
MRKIILGIFIATLLSPLAVSGQGSWLSATNVVGNGDVIITDMEVDSNGDSYIMGWFDTNIVSTVGSIASKGSYDIFLLKINSDGSHAWLKGFGGSFPDLPGGVEIGSDNSIYISGAVNGTVFFDATTSISTTAADAFLAKFQPDGSLDWVKIVAGGPKNQRSEAMAIDNDKIILTGLAVDSVVYDVDRIGYAGKFAHVSTYDLNGNHLLHNIIGFKDVGLPTSIKSTTDGYVIAGYFRDSLFLDIDSLYNQSVSPASDIYLYKLNKNLNGQWVRRTTSQFGENVAYSVRFDGTDDLYLVGKTGALDIQIDSTATEAVHVIRTSGGDQYFILNYMNSSGNLDWYTIGGSNRADGLWDVLIMPDRLISTGYYGGNFYFGNDTLINPVSKEILVTEHDLNGHLLHARDAYSEPVRDSDQGYRLRKNPSGEVVIAGVYRSEIINFEDTQFSNISPGKPDIFLATYGCMGGGSLSTSSNEILCYNDNSGEITLTPGGGFTNPHYGHEYDAFLDNGETVINRKFFTSTVFTGLPAGSYDITVYDNANCLIGTSLETITQPDSLQFTFEALHPVCAGEVTGSIAIFTPLGGVSPYQYSINCGTDFQADPVFTDLPAGDYCIVVEDANGCRTNPLDTTLVAPEPITFDFLLVHDSLKCYGDTDAMIHFMNVMGGSGEYLFSVDGGANYQADTFFVGLTGGSYQLLVSDLNTCTSPMIDTVIYQPEEIQFTFSVEHANCFGEKGSIVFDVPSGGNGDYFYSVTGEPVTSSESNFTDLAAGYYRLLVQDDSMCLSAPIDTLISEPDELIINTVTSQDITLEQNGSIEVEASGGTGPYVYVLKPGDVNQDNGLFSFIAGQGGTYTVEIDDSNNCGPVSSDPIEILDLTSVHFSMLSDALIYPNPAFDQLTIEMTYEGPECMLEIVSLTGQVILSRQAFTSGGLLKETLDVSEFSKGMYMVRVDGFTLRSGIIIH